MAPSGIQGIIQKRKEDSGDFLADAIVDLCFVTSYKIEELINMDTKILNRLLERYKHHYCKQSKK